MTKLTPEQQLSIEILHSICNSNLNPAECLTSLCMTLGACLRSVGTTREDLPRVTSIIWKQLDELFVIYDKSNN